MSYRDDHAAALARAEALEAELARTVAERDRLRVELARTRAERSRVSVQLPRPLPMLMYMRPLRPSGAAIALRVAVLVAVIGAAVLAMTAVHQPTRAARVELAPLPEPVAPPPHPD